MSEFRLELGRKAFHLLALVYLGAFRVLGWPSAGWVMAAWLVVVTGVEALRLKFPPLERALFAIFGSIFRADERTRFSGVFHASAGVFAAMLIARGDQIIISAAITQLALGDAASAIVGRAFGRTKLFGGPKSLEGSLAGLAVGFAAALACGARPAAACACALAGVLAELLPADRCDDNFWIPVAAASAMALVGAA